MAKNLATKFLPYVDEKFSAESKKSLLTNQDFDWTGAHTVNVYKINTSAMNDYNRNPTEGFTGSRYGTINDLDATTEEFTLKKDRSFTFAIDKLEVYSVITFAFSSSRIAKRRISLIAEGSNVKPFDVNPSSFLSVKSDLSTIATFTPMTVSKLIWYLKILVSSL